MIRKAEKNDALIIARMAVLMWKDHTVEDLEGEFKEIICSDKGAVFLALADDQVIGFAQCQLRHDYVEGTSGGPVGYLEGIFVKEEYRNLGYAGKLLGKCEEWARKKDCREFASDCELHNKVSFKFHLKMGFSEVNRIICFTKKL